VVDNDSIWTRIVDDRDDSPGSQIAQELAATTSQQDSMEQGFPQSKKKSLPAGRMHILTSLLKFVMNQTKMKPC